MGRAKSQSGFAACTCADNEQDRAVQVVLTTHWFAASSFIVQSANCGQGDITIFIKHLIESGDTLAVILSGEITLILITKVARHNCRSFDTDLSTTTVYSARAYQTIDICVFQHLAWSPAIIQKHVLQNKDFTDTQGQTYNYFSLS